MSVAIPIPLLQHLPDVNVTLGVGVDEYALCWDNDTAKFVLRAVAAGVTDHGALTGLTPDDDHTQYALLAGRAGGQTLYGGTAANDDITIHGTSDGTRTTSYVLLQPSGGNVGIGTSAPGAILTVSAAKNAAVLRLQTTNDDSSWADTDSYGAIDFWASDTSDNGPKTVALINAVGRPGYFYGGNAELAFSTAYGTTLSEKMRITSSGNVGIGTVSPATALHVVGAATITGGIRPAADGTTALQLQTAAGASVLNVDTTNGQVGIGTTSPGAKLEVQGGHIFATYSGGSPFIRLADAVDSYDYVIFRYDSVGKYGFIQSTADYTAGKFVINPSGGNVGIGTTAPAEKLDVTGNINTTGVVKVDDVQVLSNRVIDARCADVANSGDATTDGLIDALRDAMIAHGLIAAA